MDTINIQELESSLNLSNAVSIISTWHNLGLIEKKECEALLAYAINKFGNSNMIELNKMKEAFNVSKKDSDLEIHQQIMN